MSIAFGLDREYIDIGPTPAEEECEQLGLNYNARKAMEECRCFIRLIRSKLGNEPDGAQLAIKGNDHEYGRYYEVVCWYAVGNEAAAEYAFKCEAEAPARWEDGFRPEAA